jgi:hypothetical protein
MVRGISVPAYALLLAACGPAVSSAPFLAREPRPADHEIRLYSTRLPTCRYEEIGLIQVKRRHGSLEEVLDAVRQHARIMGGDGVIALGQTQTTEGGTVVGTTVSLGASEGLAGTVIRFTETTCPERDG